MAMQSSIFDRKRMQSHYFLPPLPCLPSVRETDIHYPSNIQRLLRCAPPACASACLPCCWASQVGRYVRRFVQRRFAAVCGGSVVPPSPSAHRPLSVRFSLRPAARPSPRFRSIPVRRDKSVLA